MRHGLLARAVLIDAESRERFDELVRILNETLKPNNPIEHLLIGKMAAAHWRQIRIWHLAKTGKTKTGNKRDALTSLDNSEMRFDRQFFRILDRYFRLQTFFGETNPANSSQSLPAMFSEPGFQPEITRPEPAITRPEPAISRPEPAITRNEPDETEA
jgi:hypothetical protein